MDEVTFSREALSALKFRVPEGNIRADLGEGPAKTVHLLPSEVDCQEVVFVAEGYEMDKEGYWIAIDRLRKEDRWVPHLSEKKVAEGQRPAVVMLAEALSAKHKNP
jgi:hypothetical protein